MNKRGFELSINFIVTLIIAIVILSFGIYFVKMIYEKSTEMKLTLDQQTEMELERLMDSGEKVSIYPGRRTVSSGETAKFGLGILNILGEDTNFKVIIEPSQYNNIIGETTWIQTSAPENGELIINNNKKKYLIGITPSGTSGTTYVFNIKVGPYDELKKVYVKVS